ncbi:LacI family DNA-binding transcriptional regulator [Amycolatopsis sp. NPDC051371]|uniref:LacI family DNA-binding transcriptional regulator n=1 Tax=Amycolatopsis sp. NPDC051371 TaxID=3155800 RepID=UPI0034217955
MTSDGPGRAQSGESARAKRATSTDVARLAGVSRATVSYVLNNAPHQKISDATRRRVLEAADALDYWPSAQALALASGRTSLVLCLWPAALAGRHLGIRMSTMTRHLAKYHLTLVTHWLGKDSESALDVCKILNPVAVVSYVPLSEEETTAMRTAGADVIEVVVGGSREDNSGVWLGEESTGEAQARYLAEAGHRRLGYAYPAAARLEQFARPRLAGVRQACRELGLPGPQVLTVPPTPEEAAAAIHTWTSGARPVTAVCAYDDEMALVMLAGLRENEMRAPDDLSLIGVDDIPACVLTDPPLTTVRIDVPAHATEIARKIVHALSGDQPWSPLTDTCLAVVERGTVRRQGDRRTAR